MVTYDISHKNPQLLWCHISASQATGNWVGFFFQKLVQANNKGVIKGMHITGPLRCKSSVASRFQHKRLVIRKRFHHYSPRCWQPFQTHLTFSTKYPLNHCEFTIICDLPPALDCMLHARFDTGNSGGRTSIAYSLWWHAYDMAGFMPQITNVVRRLISNENHEVNLTVTAAWQPLHASLVRPAWVTQLLSQCLCWRHPANKSS